MARGRQILSDQTAIATCSSDRLAENRLPSLFSAAEAWRERLQSEVEAGAALSALVDRVDLTDTGIRVSLKLPIPSSDGQPRNANPTADHARFPNGHQAARRRDASGHRRQCALAARRLALLKAVARARQWSEDLLRRAQSVAEIAEREGVGARYVRRLMRLAFLAPEIVEVIAAGNQPPELTAEALAERIDLLFSGPRKNKPSESPEAGLALITSAAAGQVDRRNDPIVLCASGMDGTASLASRDSGNKLRSTRQAVVFSGAVAQRIKPTTRANSACSVHKPRR